MNHELGPRILERNSYLLLKYAYPKLLRFFILFRAPSDDHYQIHTVLRKKIHDSEENRSKVMSSFPFVLSKSSLSTPLLPASKSPLLYSKEISLCFSGNGLLLYNSFRIKKLNLGTSCRRRRLPNTYNCKLGENENQNQSNGEEAPESLFMKELTRRGMKPTSLLEETKTEQVVEGSSQSRDDPMPKSSILNQREQSMALNSEGLEGLIPRAKSLLTLGGTFFLSFGPLILLTVAFFLVVYLYFGPSFVHGGNDSRTTIPQYIDPYQLLEEERITAKELKL